MTSIRAFVALLVFVLPATVVSADPADPVNAWIAPAKVNATITPCLKTTGDDQPSKATPCTTKYITACSGAGNDTTMAMTECGDAAVTYWRGVVTRRTNALLAKHDKDVTAYINASDPAWKQYVKTRCSMYGLFDGTMWGPVGVNCVLSTTVERADDLAILAGHGIPAGQ